MTTTRSAETVWQGSLMEGSGQTSFSSSGSGTFPVSWPARSEEPQGKTSPEELIAAAHSACFSMALSHALAQAGHPAERLTVRAEVDFKPGTGITEIRLNLRGTVPGLEPRLFADMATAAKENCPVSKALAAVPISLTIE